MHNFSGHPDMIAASEEGDLFLSQTLEPLRGMNGYDYIKRRV